MIAILLFNSLITDPISPWPLAADQAFLQIYSTVHSHIKNKLNFQTSTFGNTHLKHLHLNTFVTHTSFKPVNFSNKLKFLHISPYENFRHYSDVTYELMAKDGSTIHTHRSHMVPYCPKDPLVDVTYEHKAHDGYTFLIHRNHVLPY